MKSKDVYNKMRKKYTDEELVDSFVFPHGLTEDEKAQADAELWSYRKQLLETKSKKERIYAGILKVKYQILSQIESTVFSKEKGIAYFLQEYMKVTNKKQRELAEDLKLHSTRLSRIMNHREKLSLPIAYRLEKHSGGLIPALFWWKLLQMEIEQEIKTDQKERVIEQKKVTNVAYQG